MTTLELNVNLSDRLAREARAAGLLTPQALAALLKDAMRRRAAQTLLAGAARATAAGNKPLSMDEIQAEVSRPKLKLGASSPRIGDAFSAPVTLVSLASP